jgi:DNA-binding MurR/RpiR family transcriptional regulator
LTAVANGAFEEGGTDSVLVRLRARLPEFTGALRRVAEHVLTDPAGASRATNRRARGAFGHVAGDHHSVLPGGGLRGLRRPSPCHRGGNRPGRPLGRLGGGHRSRDRTTDPLERVLRQIMAADTQAMRDTAAMTDIASVERAADAIASASRVDIYGASGSALVGAEMQFSLHRIGVAAWSWPDVHNGLASAAMPRHARCGPWHLALRANPRDGRDDRRGGQPGATTIALTSFPRSPLADVADIVLLTATQATTFRPDALSARHPQLVVLDLLYIAVAQRTHDRSHAAFQRTAQAVAGTDSRRWRREPPTPAAMAGKKCRSYLVRGDVMTQSPTARRTSPPHTAAAGSGRGSARHPSGRLPCRLQQVRLRRRRRCGEDQGQPVRRFKGKA